MLKVQAMPKLHFEKVTAAYKALLLVIIIVMLLLLSFFMGFGAAIAAENLNTSIPGKTYNIPAGPLGKALATYASFAGVSLGFDPVLAEGKTTAGIKGEYSLMQGFTALLKGSGLEVVGMQDGSYQLRQAPKLVAEDAGKNLPEQISLKEITVRSQRFYEVGPLPGLGLTKEEIPGNVQSISAKEIKESNALSISDLMNSKLQSVSVNDYQSNPFQMDVNYRGFTASPQLGTAQGISVFLDGIRVNEPFGDVVNWDMIPMNALKSLDVFPGSNPVFGLGTLGGALTMRTKSGFDGKSADAQILTGSFGRKQLQVSAGGNNGIVAGFLSGNFFLEDGWRDDSPSRVNQVFGKGEWRSDRLQLSLSGLYAGNKLTGNGLLPQQMVDQNPKQVYTSPDESKNDLLQFQLSGIWDVTDTFNITGQIYKRNSKRKTSTSDVNENFGGSTAGAPAIATANDPSKQILFGLPDINRDGLPDYNNYAYNVAADANGNPLTNSGTVCDIFVDPSCANDLAVGTQFAPRDNNGNLQPIVANQAIVTAVDGSGTPILNWTFDPRRNLDDISSQPSNIPGAFNAPVTTEYEKVVRYGFGNRGLLINTNNLNSTVLPQLISPIPHPSNNNASFNYDILSTFGSGGVIGAYTDNAGFYHDYYELFVPINLATQAFPLGSITSVYNTAGVQVPGIVDANGNFIYRDGKYGGGVRGPNSGYIDGTPTAIFTDTKIDQVGTGGSMQLNWNLDKHKFMLGTSIDKADSTYVSKQYLGLLDANRHGFVASEQLGWEYYANSPERGLPLNDFTGSGITKSIYASETWTPIKKLNFTASARFNHSVVDNQLAVNRLSSFGDVNRIFNILNTTALCTDSNNDGTIDSSTECPLGLGNNVIPFDPSYAVLDQFGQPIASLRPAEREVFKYRSFNPSLGATWQAREDLNVYANLSRGARTPTVIELGCAYDPTPLSDGRPRSIAEQRVCNLPGALSGDPYLKQVRSTSFEFGARGRLTENIEWNASVYRTDLTDDIYFVAVNATSSYFQNIGDTRRQGLEMGIKGKQGKARFGLNYSLTDATFQSPIDILSAHNSSANNVYDINSFTEAGTFGKIKVEPGNRIPGIPMHNLNANFNYDVTDKWTVGFTAIMHSSAFIRGNENNKHRAGPASPLIGPFCNDPVSGQFGIQCTLPRADFGDGTTAGYTVVNFRTSYKLSPEWTLGLIVNNIFDKQYASAGRLGLNAFSPSTNGAVGTNGFNYNSSEWQGTSFLGIGAPRAGWLTLSYEFNPDNK